MTRINFSYLITNFFITYLTHEAGLSSNTVKSYRDTFILFFKYLDENSICKIKKLDISVLTSKNVNGFLVWLEEVRLCSISSRNQRLAALKSFCNYIIRRCPEECFYCQDILKMRTKKAPQKPVEYLTVDAITHLMDMPDPNTIDGIKDLSILALMYEAGCRVQELIDLKVGNISFRAPNTVTLTGKGMKTRVIPISHNVADILKIYIQRKNINEPDHALFFNRYGKVLSRSGISYILNKYMQMAKQDEFELYTTQIHPHMLRHSKAMHLLENGVNLIYIRDFLGHSSVTTTEIYARCNPELKRKYIEQSANLISDAVKPYSNNEKESLLSWLRENI